MNTPVLFLIFNRPDTAQRVFDEIRKARPKHLYIAADGPRELNDRDKILCQESRAIIEQVDWPCEVKTLFRDKNLGCKLAVSSAINWFFQNVEAGIILEDDCVPHQSFFRFASEILEKYKNEEKVMMIAGLNPISEYHSPYSYYFSRYFSIWGWATWRRAWQKYDIEMREWPRAKEKLATYYADPYARKYLERSFDNAYSGKLNTWDIQWFLTCLVQNGLSIVPSKNLINNIGIFGDHAEGDVSSSQNLQTFNLCEQSLASPPSITVDEAYDDAFYTQNFHPKRGDTFRKICGKMKKILGRSSFLKKVSHRMHIFLFGYGMFENVNHTSYEKKALLLYIVEPFRNPQINYAHQNYSQARELAKVVGAFGYNVDVIQFNDPRAKLTKKYDLVIDLHPKINAMYKNNLNPGAKRVAYVTGSNPSFSNQAEDDQLFSVQRAGTGRRDHRHATDRLKSCAGFRRRNAGDFRSRQLAGSKSA